MINGLRMLAEGSIVHLIFNGKLVDSMPWEKALEISKALYQVSKVAESSAKAEGIIADEALLIRSGLANRVGLSSDQRVLKQAWHDAQHDRNLRRYLPQPGDPNIKPSSVVHPPTVKAHPPKETKNDV